MQGLAGPDAGRLHPIGQAHRHNVQVELGHLPREPVLARVDHAKVGEVQANRQRD